MKTKPTLLISAVLMSIVGVAQENSDLKKKVKISYVYANIGAEFSDESYSGVDASGGGYLILSNNWGASISINDKSRRAKELPNDYQTCPPSGAPFMWGGWSILPRDYLDLYSLRIVKEFPTKTALIRFGLEGGISLAKMDYVKFIPTPPPYSTCQKYKLSSSTSTSVGASLRVKAELPLTRFVGLEVAAITNINKYIPYVGFELHLTAGLVRHKIKTEKDNTSDNS